MSQESVRVNLRSLFLALVIFLLALIVLGPAVINGDPTWFLPFNETPERIIVYRAGKHVVLLPGDPRFETLKKEVNRALSSIQAIDMVGPSAETIAEYRTQETCVELLYDRPVQLKSNLRVGQASAIIIPLTGLHTDRPRAFTGTHEKYGAGALVMKDLSRVRRAVNDLSF